MRARRIWGGRLGHASTMRARSGSRGDWGAEGGSGASDFAPLWLGVSVFPEGFEGCSNPHGVIGARRRAIFGGRVCFWRGVEFGRCTAAAGIGPRGRGVRWRG